MTSTLSPRDTGEIQRIPGDATQNLTPFQMHPPVRRPQVFRPVDLGEVQPIAPLERVLTPTDDDTVDLRRSVPYVIPSELRKAKSGHGRHRGPSLWSQLAAVVARMWQL